MELDFFILLSIKHFTYITIALQMFLILSVSKNVLVRVSIFCHFYLSAFYSYQCCKNQDFSNLHHHNLLFIVHLKVVDDFFDHRRILAGVYTMLNKCTLRSVIRVFKDSYLSFY